MKEFQDALSTLTDVDSLLAKRHHEDLARALKSKPSFIDGRVEFVSRQTQTTDTRTEFVVTQTKVVITEYLQHEMAEVSAQLLKYIVRCYVIVRMMLFSSNQL